MNKKQIDRMNWIISAVVSGFVVAYVLMTFVFN